MVKIEFSPLHELIQDADELQAEGRTSDAAEMYGWLIDRLMEKLDAEPDPNKKKPLASKVRIIQQRMRASELPDAVQTDGLFRVTSSGTPLITGPTRAPASFIEGTAVEFMTSTGEWRFGKVHGVADAIITVMYETGGIVGFKEVDSTKAGEIRVAAIPELEPEPESVPEGVPPIGSGVGLLRPTPKSRWQPDGQCRRCPGVGCSAPEFKLTRRRHHCRGCGLVFCDRCSPETAIISAGLCPKAGVVGLEFGKPAPTIMVSLVAGKLIFGRANSDGVARVAADERTDKVTHEFDVRGCTVKRVQGRERTLQVIGAPLKAGNVKSRRGLLDDDDSLNR